MDNEEVVLIHTVGHQPSGAIRQMSRDGSKGGWLKLALSP